MLAKNNKKEKYLYNNKRQKIEKDQKDLIGKNFKNQSVKHKQFKRIT